MIFIKLLIKFVLFKIIESLADITVNISWNLLGEITSYASLHLPSSYNELLIIVVNTDDSGNNVNGSYVIPKYVMDNVVADSFIIPTHSQYYTLLRYNKGTQYIGYNTSSQGSNFKKMVVFYR